MYYSLYFDLSQVRIHPRGAPPAVPDLVALGVIQSTPVAHHYFPHRLTSRCVFCYSAPISSQ